MATNIKSDQSDRLGEDAERLGRETAASIITNSKTNPTITEMVQARERFIKGFERGFENIIDDYIDSIVP